MECSDEEGLPYQQEWSATPEQQLSTAAERGDGDGVPSQQQRFYCEGAMKGLILLERPFNLIQG